MTTTLQPAPVSTRQVDYDASTRTFSGDMSSTRGFGRVWPDSVDEGLTLVSHRTGQAVVFVVDDEQRDAEGDVQFWTLRSVPAPARTAGTP